MEAVSERGGLDVSRVREAGDVRQGYTGFLDGDLLIAKITPCFENGKATLAAGLLGGVGFGTTELHVLRPRECDARWLFYITQSHDFMQAGEASMYGAGGQKRVPAEFLRNYRALVPRPSVQRAIADFLDRKTAAIDALIEKKERLLALLVEKRAALIHRAVTQGLDPTVPMRDSGIPWVGEMPARWAARVYRSVARVESGHTPSRSHPEYWVEHECTVPWFGLADVWQLRDGRQVYLGETAERVSEKGLAHSSARVLPARTVVLSRTASVGYAGVMPYPMATTQDFVNWVCGPQLVPEFLLLAFRAMRSEFDRLMMGSTHKTIYMPDARSLRGPLPPVDEQREIVRVTLRRLELADRMEDCVRNQLQLLGEYRQALITAAVTGQLAIDEVAA